jgi:DNA-binding transcriptional MerR regulator
MLNNENRMNLSTTATFTDRVQAVKSAFESGMSLKDIEEYLDWLDMVISHEKERDRRKSGGGDSTVI